jgi:hypothetical protein
MKRCKPFASVKKNYLSVACCVFPLALSSSSGLGVLHKQRLYPVQIDAHVLAIIPVATGCDTVQAGRQFSCWRLVWMLSSRTSFCTPSFSVYMVHFVLYLIWIVLGWLITCAPAFYLALVLLPFRMYMVHTLMYETCCVKLTLGPTKYLASVIVCSTSCW